MKKECSFRDRRKELQKSLVLVIKNLMQKLKSRLDTAGERIGELVRFKEVTQNTAQR